MYTFGSVLFRSTMWLGASHLADWSHRSRQGVEGVRMRKWGEELAMTRASYLLTDSYQSFHQGTLLESPRKGWCFLHFCLNTLHDKGFMVIMTNSAKSHVDSRKMPPPGSIQSNFGENLLVRITGFQYLFPSTCFDWLPVTRLCHF